MAILRSAGERQYFDCWRWLHESFDWEEEAANPSMVRTYSRSGFGYHKSLNIWCMRSLSKQGTGAITSHRDRILDTRKSQSFDFASNSWQSGNFPNISTKGLHCSWFSRAFSFMIHHWFVSYKLGKSGETEWKSAECWSTVRRGSSKICELSLAMKSTSWGPCSMYSLYSVFSTMYFESGHQGPCVAW